MTTPSALALAAALLVSIASPAALAAAPPVQSLEDVERRAADHLLELHGGAEGGAAVEIRALDRRLRLAPCEGELDARIVGAGAGRPVWGANVVEVSCPGGAGWRARVRASATAEREVWVLTRAVRRGEPLVPELLERRTVTLGAGRGSGRRVGSGAGTVPLDAPESLAGHEFARPLRAGSVPTGADLLPPVLVRRGRQVRRRHEGAALSVETRAVALADARRHERVNVRNERTGRRLDGVVVGADEVRIR